jgi:hypothetical protein
MVKPSGRAPDDRRPSKGAAQQKMTGCGIPVVSASPFGVRSILLPQRQMGGFKV